MLRLLKFNINSLRLQLTNQKNNHYYSVAMLTLFMTIATTRNWFLASCIFCIIFTIYFLSLIFGCDPRWDPIIVFKNLSQDLKSYFCLRSNYILPDANVGMIEPKMKCCISIIITEKLIILFDNNPYLT